MNRGGATLVKIRMRGACLVGVCGREDEKPGVPRGERYS
jgi:hypothetical protein